MIEWIGEWVNMQVGEWTRKLYVSDMGILNGQIGEWWNELVGRTDRMSEWINEWNNIYLNK